MSVYSIKSTKRTITLHSLKIMESWLVYVSEQLLLGGGWGVGGWNINMGLR